VYKTGAVCFKNSAMHIRPGTLGPTGILGMVTVLIPSARVQKGRCREVK
jgi:hypothetical protein